MPKIASHDLHSVRAEFTAWRTRRRRGERIPESLWAAAVALLNRYQFTLVCRELGISPKQLRQRRTATNQRASQRKPPQQTFLELSARELTKSEMATDSPVSDSAPSLTDGACRVVLERADGSRLCLTLPVDWLRIEALCNTFMRAV